MFTTRDYGFTNHEIFTSFMVPRMNPLPSSRSQFYLKCDSLPHSTYATSKPIFTSCVAGQKNVDNFSFSEFFKASSGHMKTTVWAPSSILVSILDVLQPNFSIFKKRVLPSSSGGAPRTVVIVCIHLEASGAFQTIYKEASQCLH